MRTNRTYPGACAALMLLVFVSVAGAQRVSSDALAKILAGPRSDLGSAPIVTNKPEGDSNGVTDKRAVIGSWLETVTFNGPMPPLKSMVSFIEDGTVLVADQGAVSTETAFSAGHGSWTHISGRTFAWTTIELLYATADGTLIGYLKVKGGYTVNSTGSAYTGQFLATILDPDGNVLFTVDGTNEGTRIPVEMLP